MSFQFQLFMLISFQFQLIANEFSVSTNWLMSFQFQLIALMSFQFQLFAI